MLSPNESVVLFAAHRLAQEPVGLLLLSPSCSDDDETDVRLGYIVGEDAWGRRFASELVAGIADWCRGTIDIRAFIGGVDPQNAASVRVVQKNGFVPQTADHEPTTLDGLIFVLDLRC